MSDDESQKVEFAAKNTERCPIREVDIRARVKMSGDSKLTYRDAVHQVFLADEVLHAAYLNSTPPLHSNRTRT